MLAGFVLFDDNFAYVGLITIVAPARHSGPALATDLFVPRKIRVVLADPPYAKTDGTVRIHWLLGNVVPLPAAVRPV